MADVTAEAQTSVKLDPIEPGLESRITFHVGQRLTYRFEIAVPDDFRQPEVTLPASGVWSIEKEGNGEGRRVLKILMQRGVLGDAAVIVHGKLAPLDARQEMALPRLEVLGVKRQEGQIAVQSDPAFDVQARDLHDCQETEFERVAAWLDPPLRALTRLALHYTGGAVCRQAAADAADAGGGLRHGDERPHHRSRDRGEDYPALHDSQRGHSRVDVPASCLNGRCADLDAPLAAEDDCAGGRGGRQPPVRVHLELQSDVMNDLRVLVENDRLLTQGSEKDPHVAPLPAFEEDAGAGRHPAAAVCRAGDGKSR